MSSHTNEMTMVERVARAIFAATGPEGCKATHGNFDILLPELQDDIRNWARAAIEAMREPTSFVQVMLRAQLELDLGASVDPAYVYFAWEAAIDAALQEKQG